MKTRFLLLAPFILALGWNTSLAQIYVKQDAAGANSGASWSDAFTDLQLALAVAQDGDQIWVAAGTYTPAAPGGDRAATFLINKNLALLGGFAGTEASADDRDPVANPTILSGDLNGDDMPDDFATNRADNAMTVVRVTAAVTDATLIDGFTISNGQADGAGGNETVNKSGGGMFASGSPTVKQSVFTQNFASYRGGGGYFNPVGNPVFEDCIFTKNKADNIGGGLHFHSTGGGSPEILNTTFQENDGLRGGGVFFYQCNAKVTGCNFLSNKTTQQGGGMSHLTQTVSNLSIEVVDCIFDDNESDIGGGLFMEAYVATSEIHYLLSNSSFTGNRALPLAPGWSVANGGAGFSFGASNSTGLVENCTFSNNTSTQYDAGMGVALYGNDMQFEMKNSTFTGNTGVFEGGGVDIYSYGGSGNVLVEDCYFEGNSTTRGGTYFGSFFGGEPSDFEFLLKNCTWKSNQAEEGAGIYFYNDPQCKLSVNMKDCFFIENTATINGGGFYAPPTYSPDSTIMVLENCTFTQNFAGSRGGGGYFSPVGNPVIKDCTFTKNKADTNRGGGLFFDSTEGGSPEILNSTFQENEALRGGGVYFYQCNAKVTGCNFLSNKTTQQGGGLHHLTQTASDLSVEIVDCIFDDNESTFGGGFKLESFGATSNVNYVISNCTVTGNRALDLWQGVSGGTAGGGDFGIGASNSTGLIENCHFSQNSTNGYDGGLYVWFSGLETQFEMRNSTFDENSCGLEDGAFGIWTFGGSGTVLVENCNVENNSADMRGNLSLGSFFYGTPSDYEFTLRNCTVKSNHAESGGGILVYNDAQCKLGLTLEDCSIIDNTASVSGGGMLLENYNPDFQVNINRSIITGNQSPDGSAIAAALSMEENVELSIENSLIAENGASSAALSIINTMDFRLLNCTVAGNESGAIGLADGSNLTLQNTVFANPGHTEYEDLSNDVTVTSLGGNLVLDNSMDVLLSEKDKKGLDPGFETVSYQPSATSPLVNAGVNNGVTATTDLAGNERIRYGIVDIGAFESPFTVTAVGEKVAGEAVLTSNPATDFLKIQFPEPITGTIEVSLFDPQGRTMSRQIITAGQTIDVSNLSAGVYALKAANGEKFYNGKFVKQ